MREHRSGKMVNAIGNSIEGSEWGISALGLITTNIMNTTKQTNRPNPSTSTTYNKLSASRLRRASAL